MDVITSYVFSSSAYAEDEIGVYGLKKYIRQFTKKFLLTEYGIKAMQCVLYFGTVCVITALIKSVVFLTVIKLLLSL